MLVVATALDEGEVRRRLGPSSGLRRFRSSVTDRDLTEWWIHLAKDVIPRAAMDAAAEAIDAIPDELPDSIRKLKSDDPTATCSLVISEDLNTDTTGTAINLNPELVRWLGEIGAAVGIDQAVY